MQIHGRHRGDRSAGFTMTELILVILMLGIMAAIALPSFTSKTEFDARGFFDQTQNMIRYAQKVAIAQRRTVWVQLDQTTGTICLTYVLVNTNCASDGGVPVADPDELTWYKKTAPAKVSFASSMSFAFDALGRLNEVARQEIKVQQDVSVPFDTIQVEAETGYVH
jgi:MSHA pilin protein MshC